VEETKYWNQDGKRDKWWIMGICVLKGIQSLSTWQVQLIDPAINGTLNVLDSCAKAQTKKVVLTSSTLTIIFTNKRNSMGGIDESLWSDLDFCQETRYFGVHILLPTSS